MNDIIKERPIRQGNMACKDSALHVTVKNHWRFANELENPRFTECVTLTSTESTVWRSSILPGKRYTITESRWRSMTSSTSAIMRA